MKRPISVQEGPTLANYHLLLSAIRDNLSRTNPIEHLDHVSSLILGLELQGRFFFPGVGPMNPGKWETRWWQGM
jgi:hypothetical protein